MGSPCMVTITKEFREEEFSNFGQSDRNKILKKKRKRKQNRTLSEEVKGAKLLPESRRQYVEHRY